MLDLAIGLGYDMKARGPHNTIDHDVFSVSVLTQFDKINYLNAHDLRH